MGFREFWFTSLESPAYTEYVDKTYKKMSGQIEYEHEYLAIFGQAEGGVFLPDQVADCLDDYPLGQALKPEEVAIIGVDCNDTATGTHAIVIGVTPGKNGQPPRFRMVDKAILRGSEFTHTKSASMLIELYHKWDAVLLAMDKGFSQGQAESIIEYGMQNPKSRLEDRFKYYDLGSSYKFIDPMTAVEIKKPYKPLMVGFSQNVMQERRLTMPRVEDTDHGIIGQMKKFVITRVGADGRPIYSQGAEHSLTALMIGIMGWVIEVEGYEPYMPDHKLAIGLPPERADELILPVSTRRMPTSNKSREPREASQDLQRIPMNAPFRKRRSGPSSLRKHF
jgi:hypothetical protein